MANIADATRIIGSKQLMKNGEVAEVIEYFNYHNITVKFEDGTVRKHVQMVAFKQGFVNKYNENDGLSSKHVDEENLMEDGSIGKIIRYYNESCITVAFSNGNIIENLIYKTFLKGKLSSERKTRERHPISEWVGKRILQHCGQYAEIIAASNSKDITVRFEDGTIREHATLSAFKSQAIKNPNIPDNINIMLRAKKKYIGMVVLQSCALDATCIDYINSNNITVRFEDGVVRKNVAAKGFVAGSIAHPNSQLFQVKQGNFRKVKQKCGLMAEVTGVFNWDARRVNIRFEDGAVKEDVNLDKFYHGKVGHPKLNKPQQSKDKCIGKDVMQKCGQSAKIIEYKGTNNIVIRFEDGTVRKHIELRKFLEGKIVPIQRLLEHKFNIEKQENIKGVVWCRFIRKKNGERLVGTLEEILSSEDIQ